MKVPQFSSIDKRNRSVTMNVKYLFNSISLAMFSLCKLFLMTQLSMKENTKTKNRTASIFALDIVNGKSMNRKWSEFEQYSFRMLENIEDDFQKFQTNSIIIFPKLIQTPNPHPRNPLENWPLHNLFGLYFFHLPSLCKIFACEWNKICERIGAYECMVIIDCDPIMRG